MPPFEDQDQERLWQKVNAIVGPVTRAQFAKRMDEWFERADAHLAWRRSL